MVGSVFLIFGIIAAGSAGLLFCAYLDKADMGVPGVVFLFSLFILAWASLSCLFPKEYTYIELKVHKIENVDIAVYKHHHTNLNEKFGRSFNEGDSVYLKQIVPGWYGGMYYGEYREILLEKPEQMGYNNLTE